jgi:hypothetical protein
MLIEVIATLRFEGAHRWPEATRDVEFLKHTHRHVFHIEARKKVTDPNREIEVITLKRAISGHLECSYPEGDLGTLSCEQLAMELIESFSLSYCEVLEDGENGAAITV